MSNRKQMFVLSGLFAAVALSLTACGGGDDSSTTPPAPAPAGSTLNPGTGVSDGETPSPSPAPAPTPSPSPAPAPAPTPAPPPPPAPLKGQVTRNAALQNVLVCLDLNANDACDADEPASARTGVDGAYSVDIAQVPAAKLASSSLIALVNAGAVTDPGTAIDQGDPTVATTAVNYVMRRAPGTGGPINPLTTLVQAGVAAGMTDADARKNVAIQLGIDAAKIDNYQDDPPYSTQNIQDTARAMAVMTSWALRTGKLSVADQSEAIAASPGSLASLSFTDASNYSYRTLDTLAKPAGETSSHYKDARAGKSNGTALTNQQLYNTSYLGPNGWVHCNDTVAHPTTQGNPSRSNYCLGQPQVGYSNLTSIADRSMAEVLQELKADAASFSYPVEPSPAILGALGNAKFPAGSSLIRRSNLALASSIYINSLNTDGRPQSEATTLEQLIAAKPASGVKPPSPNNSLTLGVSSSNARNLRVAFTGTTSATGGTVQYYECDLNADQSVASNCAATTTGTYTISTVNGVRVMRFGGQPASIMNHTRVYAELDWGGTNGKWVYQAREVKSDLSGRGSSNARLNATAWAAMKSQLGI